MSSTYREVNAFWKAIRQGKKAKYTPRAPGRRRQQSPGVAHRLKDAKTPSALAAHRAALEHDYFRGNPVRVAALREAAADFDALMEREKQARPKGRDGRARGKAINVPRSRRRAA
jgi:hypothetical protein